MIMIILRFLGALAPHSADWLEAMPIANCGLFLSDDEVSIAVGLRLGSTLCLPHSCPCGKEVDALGLHCFRIQKRLWQANATRLAQQNSGQVVAKSRDSGQEGATWVCAVTRLALHKEKDPMVSL